jgi:hypothetical protein
MFKTWFYMHMWCTVVYVDLEGVGKFSLEKVVAKHAPTDKLKLQVARTRDNCLPLFVARWD